MTIRRASLILPCHSWDDFPAHLGDQASAELLTAWTSLWHPALIATTEHLPGWHQAEEPPDPASLDAELILVPPPSRERMPSDWCDRFRATGPQNPPPVDTVASRPETVAAVLAAAGVDANQVDNDTAADFFALGFAYLQVELLTRAMRYSSVLDTEHFENATVAAAKAAIAGQQDTAREELTRAFDLLADARNHVYSVDFYVIDLTLLAESMLGEPLKKKLARRCATNLLIAGSQIEQIAREQPDTLHELLASLEAGTVSLVGGKFDSAFAGYHGPEALLTEINRGQAAARTHLNRDYEVYGQFDSAFSHLLPQVLKSLGFRGALHAAFDGGQLPRADQRKTHWGAASESSIEALSITPLDAARPETWLKLPQRIGDTVAHDHVATILLASWPGVECEFFDDLRRAAKYGAVLGKLVTLDEYFRNTREADSWTTFNPREYPQQSLVNMREGAISDQITAYRGEVESTQQNLGAGLLALSGLRRADGDQSATADSQVVINPWSFRSNAFVGFDPLATDRAPARSVSLIPDVLGCGYRAVVPPATLSPVALVEGLTLRNEQLELTVNNKTGGIQSLRSHRDRGTRVSQRLVFHHLEGSESIASQMLVSRVDITRNEPLVAEITSIGRIVDAKNQPLANFTQRVSTVRGIQPMLVDIELEPQRLPTGSVWKSYFASRIAWVDEALDIRRGADWGARATTREFIESPEWVEIDDVTGRITCFAMGLPYHRRAAPNWLDTLLIASGEDRRRFQFAIGLDIKTPTLTAVSLVTSGKPIIAELPGAASAPHGWFIHLGAKNALVTHIEALAEPAPGLRIRILEIDGRDAHAKLSAFRPFTAARRTDFRGNSLEVLSVIDGAAQIDLGPHRWVQIEAEW